MRLTISAPGQAAKTVQVPICKHGIEFGARAPNGAKGACLVCSNPPEGAVLPIVARKGKGKNKQTIVLATAASFRTVAVNLPKD